MAAALRGNVSQAVGLSVLVVWLFGPIDVALFVAGRGRTARDAGFDRPGPLVAVTAPLVVFAVVCVVGGAAVAAFALFGLVSMPWSLFAAKRLGRRP